MTLDGAIHALGLAQAKASSEEALLRAIRENPEDDAPRAVYGDWLLERSDPIGEFLSDPSLRALRRLILPAANIPDVARVLSIVHVEGPESLSSNPATLAEWRAKLGDRVEISFNEDE